MFSASNKHYEMGEPCATIFGPRSGDRGNVMDSLVEHALPLGGLGGEDGSTARTAGGIGSE